MKQLLIATNNAHKVDEISVLLFGLNVELVTPGDLGIEAEPEEDGSTFRENALIKARFFARASGLPSLADDSGLEVDALGGRPGIYSSRYAPTSPERNRRLLEEMRGVAEGERSARFVCAAALVTPEGEEIVEVGKCEGVIAHEPSGGGGFGYDPVFFLPDVRKTMAEISSKEKNARSHRGKAFAAIRKDVERLLG